MWSEQWAQKVTTWHEHVVRSERYGHVNAKLLSFHGSQWLLGKRTEFIPWNGQSSRITCAAGRTGTRLNIGRPQVRWEDGVALAREVAKGRHQSESGGAPLTIGTRIRKALDALRVLI